MGLRIPWGRVFAHAHALKARTDEVLGMAVDIFVQVILAKTFDLPHARQAGDFLREQVRTGCALRLLGLEIH